MTQDSDDDVGIRLLTQPTPDGSFYQLVLEVGEDYSQEFDEDAAVAYARAMLDAAQVAEYFAAITAQMTALEMGEEVVHELLRTLLSATGRPMEMPVGPFLMRGGTARHNGQPMLVMTFQGRRLGAWTLKQARDHALYVLEASLAAQLDTRYHQVLLDYVELDEATARAVVHDVGTHREEPSDE